MKHSHYTIILLLFSLLIAPTKLNTAHKHILDGAELYKIPNSTIDLDTFEYLRTDNRNIFFKDRNNSYSFDLTLGKLNNN